MPTVNTYDNYITESLRKEFKKLLHNITSYFGSEDDIEKLESDLLRLLTNYKNRIINGEIRRIDDQFIEGLKDELNKDVVEQLNLDTFFRGINNLKVKGKDRKIDKYFADYMLSVPDRLKAIYNAENIDVGLADDPSDIDTEGMYYDPYLDDKEFAEWREVVSTAPRFRVKRRRFEIEKAALHIELLKMRDWLYKNNKKLVILCSGRDASGKGSFIRTATENLHPAYFKINSFGVPTEHEKIHWFDRYEKCLPDTEQIAFYDRSWYNRAEIEPVMGYCTEDQYKKFMEDVLPFEYKLLDNGIFLIKFWFSITDKTQELRFKLRKTSPLKYWKFSPNDAKVAEKWDAFTAYKEEMFRKTSTEKSPWVIVDSNDKRIAKLNALRYILTKIPYDRKKEEVLGVYPEIVQELI